MRIVDHGLRIWTGKHKRSADGDGESGRSKMISRITMRNRMGIDWTVLSYS